MTGAALWEPAAHAFPTERLDEFLLWAAGEGATDIAFSTGLPAFMEVDGRLRHATGGALDGPAMARVAGALHVSRERAETELRGGGAIDCSHTARGPGRERRRFRVNMLPLQTRGRWGMGVALRVLPEDIPELGALGVEAQIVDALQLGEGICLVTGVPGSGKSTILAAAMRRLLERGLGKVQTFESPIEFQLDGVKAGEAFIEQTEVPTHVGSFADGLRAALRRRPAAVMVGEARDLETIEAVVNAADFGIAVYSTAHVVGVSAAIRRLLTAFPPDERAERTGAARRRSHRRARTCSAACSPGTWRAWCAPSRRRSASGRCRYEAPGGVFRLRGRCARGGLLVGRERQTLRDGRGPLVPPRPSARGPAAVAGDMDILGAGLVRRRLGAPEAQDAFRRPEARRPDYAGGGDRLRGRTGHGALADRGAAGGPGHWT